MFIVEWPAEVIGHLKKLDKEMAKRIVEKTESIKEVPYHFLTKLVGTDLWRLRVGDYRVLVRIDENGKKVFVVRVGHRKNIYK